MTVYLQDPDVTLHHGDVLETLRGMPDGSVDCVITSPPYWGLRDYGTGGWVGGDPGCDHSTPRSRGDDIRDGDKQGTSAGSRPNTQTACKCGATRQDQQLGLEATPDLFVARMVEVFREVRRVLAAHGTCWVNLGDSYAASGATGHGGWDGNNKNPDGSPRRNRQAGDQWAQTPTAVGGLKPKDLCGIPWRVAFALQADGWCLRSDVVWSKPNPMPESVTDRPTKAHEYVFLLTKCEWRGIENPLRLDRADAMWLAAMIDGEGSVCVNTRKGAEGEQPTYSAALRCYNASREIIERVAALTGVGTIGQTSGSGENGTRVVYRWQCGGKTAVPILDAIEPYLIAKRQQAHLLLELQGMRRHHGGRTGAGGAGANPRPALLTRRQEEIARGCSELNRTGETDVLVVPWKRGYWKPLPYTFDQEAVREPTLWAHDPREGQRIDYDGKRNGAEGTGQRAFVSINAAGRNIRSVWEIATQPYPEAHFATYPEELVRRCLLAGTSERGKCPQCGAPWERIVVATGAENNRVREDVGDWLRHKGGNADGKRSLSGATYKPQRAATDRWRPTCSCVIVPGADEPRSNTLREGRSPGSVAGAAAARPDCTCAFDPASYGHGEDCPTWSVIPRPVPCVVLDPFIGSGTTAYVARKHGRHAIGIDLNADYLALAARRLQQQSLFAEGVA